MSNRYLEKIAQEGFKDRAIHTAKYTGGAILGGSLAHGAINAFKNKKISYFADGAAEALMGKKRMLPIVAGGLAAAALTSSKKN